MKAAVCVAFASSNRSFIRFRLSRFCYPASKLMRGNLWVPEQGQLDAQLSWASSPRRRRIINIAQPTNWRFPMMKHLRRCLLPLLPVLIALGLSHGQAATQAPAKADRHFLMWKVTSPTNTVYLFGSIHVGDSNLYPLPKAVESAFAASKVLAVEFNVKKVDMLQMTKLMQEYGMYANGETLSQHLPKETAEALDQFCSQNGVPRIMLDKTKPWVAAIAVIAFAAKAAGEDPELGIDMHFLNEEIGRAHV